ncbi:MAG TPA: TusE/DsrC/DsvC family sulfur relay protein [Chromatiales bacterium]|nr:TusE/DsrC/DsvC family sulfur relay protein [Thiotrichales bacterium]HIP67970.1 TusE/DsrC/DsvC family sulfur relay protein [Chromatiales bacterium]
MNSDTSFTRETSDLIGLHTAPRWAGAKRGEFEATVRLHAEKEGIDITDDHWRAIRSVVTIYAEHGDEVPSVRLLSDILERHFAKSGGKKHLYKLFPKGPIKQICTLAELPLPAGVSDSGFGASY